MNAVGPSETGRRGASPLAIVKYTLFALIFANLFYYVAQDIQYFQRFGEGTSLWRIIVGFTTSIEYVCWVILIVAFEFESRMSRQSEITGPMKWAMMSAVALGCAGIAYSMYGFVADLEYFDFFEPYSGDVCALTGDEAYFLDEKWRYIDATRENCGELVKGRAFYFEADGTFTDERSLTAAQRLAQVEVLNAAVWLLLVALTQAELLVPERQLARLTSSRILEISRAALYCILFAVAIYWSVFGELIDTWDALLWLAAFFIVDLNTFQLSD